MADFDVSSLGVIMGIWAHPDDETMSIGGLSSIAAAQGQRVVCVTATKGEAGIQDPARWPPEALASIREQEMAKGLEILGIKQHYWLDYSDGKCAEVPEAEAVEKLQQLIAVHNPDTIITFPPDGLTGHPDHAAVSRWARQAAALGASHAAVYFAVSTTESFDEYLRELDEQFNIFFATDNPVFIPEQVCDVHLSLPEEAIAKKVRVMEAMPSQYAAWIESIGPEKLTQSLASESLVKADRMDEFWPEFR